MTKTTSTAGRPARKPFCYYDAPRHWTKRVEPHLGDERLNRVLVRDFHKFTIVDPGMPFRRGMFPRDFETGDWDLGHWGREPRFWRYVKAWACHWLVNFYLRLAELAEPSRTWRIVTSEAHSTVWDGGRTLFDLTSLAMGFTPESCFEMADEGGRRLPPGKEIQTGWPESNQEFAERRRAERQAG